MAIWQARHAGAAIGEAIATKALVARLRQEAGLGPVATALLGLQAEVMGEVLRRSKGPEEDPAGGDTEGTAGEKCDGEGEQEGDDEQAIDVAAKMRALADAIEVLPPPCLCSIIVPACCVLLACVWLSTAPPRPRPGEWRAAAVAR